MHLDTIWKRGACAGCLVMVILASPIAAGADAEVFVPVAPMVIAGPEAPTEAELLAVRAFNRALERFGCGPMASAWGLAPEGPPLLRVGTRATCEDLFNGGWGPDAPEGDIGCQSYVIAADGPGGVAALGGGRERNARGTLGLSYALGELLRRLEWREGQWGFVLPAAPVRQTPKMPQRLLYLMNNIANCVEGLSLEYGDEAAIEDYVDRLVEARYSRLSLWQWSSNYLYPGSHEDSRTYNEMVHRKMRHFFDYGRRRGLQIVHMLTPAHANVSLLPDDPKFWGTGYYGKSSVCWSQPEARELARSMARQEMEYYGPVDGYVVWFYDPGGCFCETCKANQAARLFEQLMLVHELAASISPGAFFEATLWPTWAFVNEKTIPYSNEAEVKALVDDFLKRCLDQFGPRELTIMDSCEAETTNLYNGYVDPARFQRNAFMYTVLGMAGECGAAFPPFRFEYLSEVLDRARDRGLEEGTIFLMYTITNFPSVYAFADILYEGGYDWRERIARYASTVAKSADSRQDLVELLAAAEDLFRPQSLNAKAEPLRRMEAAWERLEKSPHVFADKDWLRGYVKAQRHYLTMAEAQDKGRFEKALQTFRDDVGAIPLYSTYMKERLGRDTVTRLHLPNYWLSPEQRTKMVGWFE